MPRPYIRNPMQPFKLDTSVPIGPQLVAHGITVDGDENNYILDDARIAVQNHFDTKIPEIMMETHRCGCQLNTRQTYRAQNGQICKYDNPAVITQKCTLCEKVTVIGEYNESHN